MYIRNDIVYSDTKGNLIVFVTFTLYKVSKNELPPTHLLFKSAVI